MKGCILNTNLFKSIMEINRLCRLLAHENSTVVLERKCRIVFLLGVIFVVSSCREMKVIVKKKKRQKEESLSSLVTRTIHRNNLFTVCLLRVDIEYLS